MFRPISPITPEPLPGSILSAGRPLPYDYETWRTGVAATETACMIPTPMPVCASQLPVDSEILSATEFQPYFLDLHAQCQSVTPEVNAELSAAMEKQFDVASAYGVAQTLWGAGINEWLTPTLRSVAREATPAGCCHVDAAIGRLLQAYTDATGAGGAILHVPAILLPAVMQARLAVLEGDRLVGPGYTVSIGPGYSVADDGVGPGLQVVEPTAGQVRIYISGPVEYGLGPVMSLPGDYDAQTNLWWLHLVRPAIHRFNPCSVFHSCVVDPCVDGESATGAPFASSTSANAGTPGTWVPGGSQPPATVQELAAGVPNVVTANPTTPWTTGQYVQTRTAGAAGRATWSGTSWVGGVAP